MLKTKPKTSFQKKKEGPLYAADLQQLVKGLADLGKKDRVIIGGQLLLCSLEPLRANSGFIAQPPRATKASLLSQRSGARTVQLQLDKEALALVVKARQKPVFAIDALLRYGQRLRGSDEHVLLSVFTGEEASVVNALHFKKGELSALAEFTLGAESDGSFDTDLHVLLERLRMTYAQATFHWCGPLAMPRSQAFTQAPASLWTSAPGQTLTASGKPSFMRLHGPALGIVALTLTGSVAGVYLPYSKYLQARNELSSESSQLQGEFAFATERLSTLRSRQAFFETQSRNDRRLVQFQGVLAALAEEPDLRVKDARVFSLAAARPQGPAGATAVRAADFEVVVEVLREDDKTALAQSQPLLQKFSSRLGMNLRLATGDPYRDIEKNASTDGKTRRMYRIQGDLPNVN